jgi:hypothetical protein
LKNVSGLKGIGLFSTLVFIIRNKDTIIAVSELAIKAGKIYVNHSGIASGIMKISAFILAKFVPFASYLKVFVDEEVSESDIAKFKLKG